MWVERLYSDFLAEAELIWRIQLAHKTTWKELKAFASQACEVDHAEVYPPTSGFVRVKGRANFEQAFSESNNPVYHRLLNLVRPDKT